MQQQAVQHKHLKAIAARSKALPSRRTAKRLRQLLTITQYSSRMRQQAAQHKHLRAIAATSKASPSRRTAGRLRRLPTIKQYGSGMRQQEDASQRSMPAKSLKISNGTKFRLAVCIPTLAHSRYDLLYLLHLELLPL
jgi:hypothetical protein